MASEEWDFADALTVLGYFVVNTWLLAAFFQLGINVARR